MASRDILIFGTIFVAIVFTVLIVEIVVSICQGCTQRNSPEGIHSHPKSSTNSSLPAHRVGKESNCDFILRDGDAFHFHSGNKSNSPQKKCQLAPITEESQE